MPTSTPAQRTRLTGVHAVPACTWTAVSGRLVCTWHFTRNAVSSPVPMVAA